MARPKKDVAERLRVKSMMHFIINEESLRFNAHALEKHFEPENIKISSSTGQVYDSGKWRRYLHKGVFPGEKSFRKIWDRCPNAIRHVSSPFWDAIRCQSRSRSQWDMFYNRLNWQVEDLVLRYKLSPTRLIGKYFKKDIETINKLVRIGDDHAVAALIALYRQLNHSAVLNDPVRTGLQNVLIGFLSRFCPLTFLNELYAYLYSNILSQTTNRLRGSVIWSSDISAIKEAIIVEKNIFELAEKLSLVDSWTPHCEFYYWKTLGNQALIHEELASFRENLNIDLTAPSIKKGLRWLIKKLNRGRPTAHHLPISPT